MENQIKSNFFEFGILFYKSAQKSYYSYKNHNILTKSVDTEFVHYLKKADDTNSDSTQIVLFGALKIR